MKPTYFFTLSQACEYLLIEKEEKDKGWRETRKTNKSKFKK